MGQKNKPFKGKGSHGGSRREQFGKVEGGNAGRNVKRSAPVLSKQKRQQQQRQRIEAKRREIVAARRRLGASADAAPKAVAIVALGAGADPVELCNLLKGCAGSGNAVRVLPTQVTAAYSQPRQRVSWLLPGRDLDDVMCAARAADVLLFCVDADEGVDEHGDLLLACLKAQGLPSSLFCVQGLAELGSKRRSERKKVFGKFVDDELPGAKVVAVGTDSDANALVRTVEAILPKELSWRGQRAYFLVDHARDLGAATESTSAQADGDEDCVLVQMCGYLRGTSMSASQILHISGTGAVHMTQIEAAEDPCPFQRSGDRDMEMGSVEHDVFPKMLRIIDKADASLQPRLAIENDVDPFASEQTFPTEEDMAGIDDGNIDDDGDMDTDGARQNDVAQTQGMTSAQAAWLEQCGIDPADSDEDEKVAAARRAASGDNDLDMEDDGLTQEEREAERQRLLAAREEEQFPNEVDTPLDTPARMRFARYRGLKSFRTSPWDPKESLPPEYARIYEFQDFESTMRSAVASNGGPATEGTYVCVTVKVRGALAAAELVARARQRPVLCNALVEHEHKLSVVHFRLIRHPKASKAIKSKDELIFRCGFRSFVGQPIFSQDEVGCDKQMFERFFQDSRFAVASVFGPVMVPPGPVLVFRQDASGAKELVATGSLIATDPSRIVLKKIILTGLPFRVHKRRAVVRFMFYNPDDVRWFRPVELWTKLGRTGNILESVGTHGYMKCIFNKPVGEINHSDTVCMSLYKRVYPKIVDNLMPL